MIVGIANSACWPSFDIEETIKLAKANGINLAQIYINRKQSGNHRYLLEMAKLAKLAGVSVISHIDGPPKDDDIETVIKAHLSILHFETVKKTVLHYNNDVSAYLLDRLTRRGLMPFIENYHRGIDGQEAAKLTSFTRAVQNWKKNYGFDIGAVIDIGRFHSGIQKQDGSLAEKLILQTCEQLLSKRIPVIFHTIGQSDYTGGRHTWVAAGSRLDVIPQREIFERILKLQNAGSLLESVIIESENRYQAIKGFHCISGVLKSIPEKG